MAGRPEPVMPSRGAVAGMKNDFNRTKTAKLAGQQGGAADGKYDPRGIGVAWSHNFLNQKPWHPLNFRNQVKRFEHEHAAIELEKAKEKAKEEFEAEQEYLQTLSYLGPEEQQKHRDRQSVQWLYMKPPGLEAALAKEQAQAQAAAIKANSQATAGDPALASAAGDAVAVVAPTGVPGGVPVLASGGGAGKGGEAGPSERAKVLEKVREDPYAVMLQARVALQSSERWEVKHAGPERAHGGIASGARNQQYLVADVLDQSAGPADEDAAGLALLASLPPADRERAIKKLAKIQRKEEEARQLQEAQAVLAAAGYDIASMAGAAALAQGEDAKRKSKHQKKKHKSEHHKHEKDKTMSKRQSSEQADQRDSKRLRSDDEADLEHLKGKRLAQVAHEQHDQPLHRTLLRDDRGHEQGWDDELHGQTRRGTGARQEERRGSYARHESSDGRKPVVDSDRIRRPQAEELDDRVRHDDADAPRHTGGSDRQDRDERNAAEGATRGRHGHGNAISNSGVRERSRGEERYQSTERDSHSRGESRHAQGQGHLESGRSVRNAPAAPSERDR